MCAFGTGLLRTMHIEKEFVADLIPVDVVINAMVVAAWKTAQDYTGKPTIPPVYNVTSSSIRPITWGKYYRYFDSFYRNSRCLMVSTDQADSCCFYFRIS